MIAIKKMLINNTIDFAAEELKKYLWMMMPDQGEIAITYEPDATEGFRLGLLETFGLENEAPDPDLDDIVHIDTTENGGILAGSNPRSVLFAVYRFLRLNGCRFLAAGPDGEYIPRKGLEPQKYHKMADYRFRGHAVEGYPSYEQALDFIDFQSKCEMNLHCLFGGFGSFKGYYDHMGNDHIREPEPTTFSQYEQWYAVYESELQKRGIIVSGGGHDCIAHAMGVSPGDVAYYKAGNPLPAEVYPKLALVNGKRDLYRNKNILFTNLCYSNPKVRKGFVNAVVKQIEENRSKDYFSVSFADGHHNYCECEDCRKMRPSDWLMTAINEVMEELDKKGIKTKVSFGCYVDRLFAPTQVKLKYPERTLLYLCPISRSYTESITEDTVIPDAPEFQYNAWEVPRGVQACYAFSKEWQKTYTGPCVAYEYHFWRPQFLEFGAMALARRVYEDVRSLRYTKMDGCMQDGSNKSFFPNGFAHHIYAETMINRDLDFDKEAEDYFSYAYGEDWAMVRRYLERISESFDHKYLSGELSADPAKGKYYNPAHKAHLEKVRELTATMRTFTKTHKQMPTRPQCVFWRLLERHTEYCDNMAKFLIEKCQGNDNYAREILEDFIKEFGKYDYEMERYFDLHLAAWSVRSICKDVLIFQ